MIHSISSADRNRMQSQREVRTVTKYVKISLDIPVAVLCMVAEILASATYIYALSKRHVNGKVVTGYGINYKNSQMNSSFFLGYTRILMASLSIGFLLFEILVIVRSNWITTIRNRIIRGVVYLLKGIAALGAVGSLGIAAGSFEIIAATVLIIVELFFVNRLKSNQGTSDGFKAAQ